MAHHADVSAEVQNTASIGDGAAASALQSDVYNDRQSPSLNQSFDTSETTKDLGLPNISMFDSKSDDKSNSVKPLDGNPPLDPTDDWTDPTKDSQLKPDDSTRLALKPLDGNPPLDPTDDWTDPTKDSMLKPDESTKLALKPLDGNPPLDPTDDWTDPTKDSMLKPDNSTKLAARPLDGNPPLNPNDDWTDPSKDS